MSNKRKEDLEAKMAFARKRAAVQRQNKEFYANKEAAKPDPESETVETTTEAVEGDTDDDEDEPKSPEGQDGVQTDDVGDVKPESQEETQSEPTQDAPSVPELNAELFTYGKMSRQLYKTIASAENLAERLQVPAENVIEIDGLFGVKATEAQAHDLDPEFKPVK